jgi:hypothetical protein
MRLYKARCVDRGAILGFHRATTDLGTRIMAGMYTPPLRAWFNAHCHGATLHTLTGAQVAALGHYRLC